MTKPSKEIKSTQKKKKSTTTSKKKTTKKARVIDQKISKEPISEQLVIKETDFKESENISTKKTRNIFQIYFEGWKKIFSIKGRANRSEFFSFWSLSLPILFLLNPIFETSWLNYVGIFLSLIVLFALFTLTIRRFHDLGYPTPLSILIFLFVFGLLNPLALINPIFTVSYIIFVFAYFIIGVLPGQQQENKFGKKPEPASKIAIAITLLLSLFLINSFFNLGVILYEIFKYQI